jgi:hypothetical protein
MFEQNRSHEFWEWFKSRSNQLFDDPTNADIILDLDRQIQSLGPFDWEIGPFNEEFMYLAISPNLDPKLLAITRLIVKSAPKVKNWVFYDSKPQKPYISQWHMLNDVGKPILIDTSFWKYVLYKFQDGTFDIEVNVVSIDGNEQTRLLAVEIAMANILGEHTFLTLVKNVSVTDSNEFRGIIFKNLYQQLQKDENSTL